MTPEEWEEMQPYFRSEEFMCRCGCGVERMHPVFMRRLYKARDLAGVPFVISSGYRCLKHDKEMSGGGNHPTGRAADITVHNSRERFKISEALYKAGFCRVGKGRIFIHADDLLVDVYGNAVDQEVEWMYD